MGVESSVVAALIASSASLSSANVVWGDFDNVDPGFPRVRAWYRPGANTTIGNAAGICIIDRTIQVDVFTRSTPGSTAEAQAITLAAEIRAGVNGHEDIGNDIEVLHFADAFDQPSDLGGRGDNETFHRIVLFRALTKS